MIGSMTELELTRSRDDRRAYVIDGIGTLRLGGMLSRSATAEAAGGVGGRAGPWTLGRRGLLRSTFEAVDAAGDVVGEFDPRAFRRGGALRWERATFQLRPASAWKERYALADDEWELALIEGRAWGKRPVRITLNAPDRVPPGLLLFTAYIVRALAEDTASAAGATTAATSAAVSS